MAAVLICCLATDVAACGGQDTATRPASKTACGTGTVPAPYTNIDSCSAAAVLTAVATAVFSVRRGEQDQQAAFASAAPLIDPGYARRIGNSAVALWPVSGARWASAGVRVLAEAHITAEDHPADTAHSVSRGIAIDQRPGNGEDPAQFPVHMRVARTAAGGPWLVDMIEVLT